MMKILSLTFFFTLISYSLLAQVGTSFPPISGETLTDEKVMLPDDTSDKYSLIGLAYSKKAEDDLNTWFQPIYERFVMEENPNALIPEMKPDVNVIFVPMFTGIKRGASKKAKEKMQEGIDKKLHPHVLVYSGSMKPYKDALKLEEKDLPYFYVIDQKGEIVYATTGRSSVKKLKEIEDIVSDF